MTSLWQTSAASSSGRHSISPTHVLSAKATSVMHRASCNLLSCLKTEQPGSSKLKASISSFAANLFQGACLSRTIPANGALSFL